MPSLSLEPLTPSTQYRSKKSLARALANVLPIRDELELVNAVDRHVGAAIDRAAAERPPKQVVFVLAEPHVSKTDLLMFIAAVASVQKRMPGSSPRVLLEQGAAAFSTPLASAPVVMDANPYVANPSAYVENPNSLENLPYMIRREIVEARSALLEYATAGTEAERDALVKNMLELRAVRINDDGPGAGGYDGICVNCLQALMAMNAGCEVRGFDDKSQPHRVAREAAMLANATMEAELAEGASVILQTGDVHAEAMQAHLQAQGRLVVVLSSQPPNAPMRVTLPYEKRRASYLFAGPDVHTIKTDWTLEREPLNFIDFAVKAGLRVGELAPLASRAVGARAERP